MSSVIDALQVEMEELDAAMKTVREDRDIEMQAAKDKYACALKAGLAKRVALRRMLKTATDMATR